MRFKKAAVLLIISVLSILMLAGCGSTGNEDGTVADTLLSQFKEEIKAESNLEKVASKLTENQAFGEVSMMSISVEEGFLNGFDKEIQGFESGVMFAPNISTIPFVGYIFQSNEPDKLAETLRNSGQLNWNICTEADEMVVETVEDYVFFVMSPLSFEQE